MKEVVFVSEHDFQNPNQSQEDYFKFLNQADFIFLYPCSVQGNFKELASKMADVMDVNGKIIISEECCEKGSGAFEPITLANVICASFTFVVLNNAASTFIQLLTKDLYNKFFKPYFQNKSESEEFSLDLNLKTHSGEKIIYRFTAELSGEDYNLALVKLEEHYIRMNEKKFWGTKVFVFIPDLKTWIEV